MDRADGYRGSKVGGPERTLPTKVSLKNTELPVRATPGYRTTGVCLAPTPLAATPPPCSRRFPSLATVKEKHPHEPQQYQLHPLVRVP